MQACIFSIYGPKRYHRAGRNLFFVAHNEVFAAQIESCQSAHEAQSYASEIRTHLEYFKTAGRKRRTPRYRPVSSR